MSRDHYIIDGYNVLHAHPVLGPALRDDLDAARARLVAELAGFAQGGPQTIVVFDGAGNPASDGAPHHLGPLTVIFSKAGVSADAVIEGLGRRFRDRGERAVVVTSDVATRDTVFSGSVSVLSAATFIDELAGEAERRIESAAAPRRVPVSERIDANVGAALARWVRGDASTHRDD